ncbi:MAG: hypothetical protein FRX49_04924 [Trebouxia sp. A1-2]|nr:MAG: hypothetical protein FRX49_04924 [Trebouxia sp. A1-2]
MGHPSHFGQAMGHSGHFGQAMGPPSHFGQAMGPPSYFGPPMRAGGGSIRGGSIRGFGPKRGKGFQSTKPCRDFLAGTCAYDSGCSFAHDAPPVGMAHVAAPAGVAKPAAGTNMRSLKMATSPSSPAYATKPLLGQQCTLQIAPVFAPLHGTLALAPEMGILPGLALLLGMPCLVHDTSIICGQEEAWWVQQWSDQQQKKEQVGSKADLESHNRRKPRLTDMAGEAGVGRRQIRGRWCRVGLQSHNSQAAVPAANLQKKTAIVFGSHSTTQGRLPPIALARSQATGGTSTSSAALTPDAELSSDPPLKNAQTQCIKVKAAVQLAQPSQKQNCKQFTTGRAPIKRPDSASYIA